MKISVERIQQLISTLTNAKWENYNESSGLNSCEALSSGECDCGADEINREIDARIAELNADLENAKSA